MTRAFQAERFVETATLPKGVGWYDVCGQKIFPEYNKDGAVLTSSCAFIVKQDDDAFFAARIRFPMYPELSWEEMNARLTKALCNFKRTDPNGGLLPPIED